MLKAPTATVALVCAVTLPVIAYVVPSPTERQLAKEVQALTATLKAREDREVAKEQADRERSGKLAKQNEADRAYLRNVKPGYVSPKVFRDW
jgi:hypothetical protein